MKRKTLTSLLAVLLISTSGYALAEDEAPVTTETEAQTSVDETVTPKTEEEILGDVLQKFEIAMAYGRHCVKDEAEGVNANLLANSQQISYLIATKMGDSLSDEMSEDDKNAYIANRFTTVTDLIRERVDKIYEDEGCESDFGAQGKELYVLFSETPSSQMYNVIQDEIKRQQQ